jgi:regulator of protease activity HflC (stomatin/prohibitin superfamily)
LSVMCVYRHLAYQHGRSTLPTASIIGTMLTPCSLKRKGNNVSNKILFLLTIAALSFISGCSTASPSATQEVVLVYKPWIFGHGGVDPIPVKTGLAYTAWSTESIYVNMQPMKYDVEMPDIMTADGVPITFHAIMILQVTDSVALISHFGPDWYKNNLEEQFKTMVRQAVRKRGMNETAISTVALDAIDAEIRDAVIAFLKEKNLPVRLITMTVGRANPPDAIKHQRIDTAAQEQRIQTEKQTKLAEDQRKMAEESRAAADNAYREAMHLSPEQFIQLERIKMENNVCGEKGKATCTFIQNGSAVPTLSVR